MMTALYAAAGLLAANELFPVAPGLCVAGGYAVASGMGLAAGGFMAVRSLKGKGPSLSRSRGTLLAGAALLYLVFLTGNFVSEFLFPFASRQVGSIYGKGQGFSTTAIFFLLLFVTGPCEEIFWRGYLQNGLMEKFGQWKGWLLATAVYTGIHVCSLNFMLIGAAAVGGAFWGLMYLKFRRLDALIICHSVWSAFIFAVVPIR